VHIVGDPADRLPVDAANGLGDLDAQLVDLLGPVTSKTRSDSP
jgi:hypothetical protein